MSHTTTINANGCAATWREARQRIAEGWVSRRLCCPGATILRDCVCLCSVGCPTHGRICVGSHD
jgi:hypothetical protein